MKSDRGKLLVETCQQFNVFLSEIYKLHFYFRSTSRMAILIFLGIHLTSVSSSKQFLLEIQHTNETFSDSDYSLNPSCEFGDLSGMRRREVAVDI